MKHNKANNHISIKESKDKTMHNIDINKAKQTLMFYIQKGYEAGIIKPAPDTAAGQLGEEPDTYEWFLREAAKVNMHEPGKQIQAISKIMQYMQKKNMLVDDDHSLHKPGPALPAK